VELIAVFAEGSHELDRADLAQDLFLRHGSVPLE
jgi:hypothetical protein